MKKIKLGGKIGGQALVDDEDFKKMNLINWFNQQGYAAGRLPRKRNIVFLHRLVMGTPKGMYTDHKNKNRLDNRKTNLRICSRQENLRNVGLCKSNTSGFKGVSWKKYNKKWGCRIKINKKEIWIGYFDDKVKAAKAYDKA